MPYQMYQPPDYYRPSGTSRIVDLMLRKGDIQAQGAERSGQIWGGAVRGLGDIASGYFKQKEEEPFRQAQLENLRGQAEDRQAQADYRAAQTRKINDQAEQERQRDQAVQQYLSSIPPGTAPDPMKMYELAGDKGVDIAKGIQAFYGTTPDTLKDTVPVIARGFLSASPEMRASSWPAIHTKLSATGMDLGGAPKEWDAKAEKDFLPVIQGMFGPKETPTKNPTEWSLLLEAAGGDANKALQIDQSRKLALRPPVPAAGVAPSANEDDVRTLLTGGTADKIPIKGRSAAISEAKKSGGIDGTGFVPMNGQQQNKYNDFMDLRTKAVRLDALLQDPEIASALGPVVGRLIDWTKELPAGFGGQSTKVKEAFDLFRDLSDTELRKRSGAQISPKEYDRIVGFTVTPTKQPDSNKTNLRRMLGSIERALKTLGVETLPAAVVDKQERMSATNPQTGEKLYSDDGGQTWHK